MTTGCAIAGCPLPRAGGAPIELCTEHLLAAHDWVAGRVGITDVLPSPCLACGSRLGVRYPSGWLCAHCEWRVGAMPAPEMPPPRVDVVYYLRFRGRIKIGTSANPRRRIAALPHDEVVGFERGGRELEHRRHQQFAASRMPRSEWFRATDELEAHLAVIGADEPWTRYERWLSQELALRA
ncbi:GIY-YIG nuclease family protein [Leifsonia sp. H3M29-4]|uniref:GIY-YIG nuclease family protein n=1 Tax=Salinibacterium metalliresistens TaxID=3031321 RepID=UPI0023DCA679|nr:GIY-YIG nuclease family protein [Salinibacterium metalliresistens]MDF1480124.1 GIY-YIG nuclease family protein [Salinibacterium metalliresistens]